MKIAAILVLVTFTAGKGCGCNTGTTTGVEETAGKTGTTTGSAGTEEKRIVEGCEYESPHDNVKVFFGIIPASAKLVCINTDGTSTNVLSIDPKFLVSVNTGEYQYENFWTLRNGDHFGVVVDNKPYQVEDIYPHQRYNPSSNAKAIGLLRLNGEVSITDAYHQICNSEYAKWIRNNAPDFALGKIKSAKSIQFKPKRHASVSEPYGY